MSLSRKKDHNDLFDGIFIGLFLGCVLTVLVGFLVFMFGG